MESPVQSWLELQCQMIAGAEAGLAVLGTSAARWSAGGDAGSGSDARLAASVDAARESGTLVVQGLRPDASSPAAPVDVALPILRDGHVQGAVGVTVRGIAAADAKALAGLLGHGVRALELLLASREHESRHAERLGLAGVLLEHDRLPGAAHAFCAELAHALGCDQVAVGLVQRPFFRTRLRMLALSTGVGFQHESDEVRDLLAAMQEAIREDAVVSLPEPGSESLLETSAHQQLLQTTGAASVCSVPLVSRGRAIGALTLQWSEAVAPGDMERERALDAAELCGPLLDWMARAEEPVLARWVAALTRVRERIFGADRALAIGCLAAAVLLLAALAWVPASYRVAARATLEGRVQRALVAGVDGYIAEAHARAGDLVSAGDLLARLDDRDLLLERRRRASEKEQLEKQYREALAGADRTKVALLQARIEQADARLALADEQLSRTRVVAPFDGIVLRGDLDRALGSPVELGSVLFEIAPLSGYRIIVEVDGRDIADVAVGQTGRLALSALPGEVLPLEVERVTPISTSTDGRSYFRVEAVLAEPPAETGSSGPHQGARMELRPGMEGIAKIEAGRRPLLWIWTHELTDWLRLLAWSVLP